MAIVPQLALPMVSASAGVNDRSIDMWRVTASSLPSFRAVGAADAHLGAVGRPPHPDEPRVAADLAVLDEAAAHVLLDVNLDRLSAVRTRDRKRVDVIHRQTLSDLAGAEIVLRPPRDDGIVVVEVRKDSAMGFPYRAPRARRRLGMTTSEYLQTPETVLPRELAFGVLHVAEAPTTFHQRVVRDLTIALTAFVDRERLGEVLPAPVDVILDADAALIVQPDVLFVSAERSHIVSDRIAGAPDLV